MTSPLEGSGRNYSRPHPEHARVVVGNRHPVIARRLDDQRLMGQRGRGEFAESGEFGGRFRA